MNKLNHKHIPDLTKWLPVSEVTAVCPGTFGELIQGRINGRPFLVTLPIRRYAQAKFTKTDSSLHMAAGFPKTRKMLNAIEEQFGCGSTGSLSMSSQLERGKGCASSSADIVAAAMAFLQGHDVNPHEYLDLIARSAALVEPTDGVMYKGMVAFHQHHGRLIERFGAMDFAIVGCLLPGSIDTVSYNSASIEYTQSELLKFEQCFVDGRKAVRQGDLSLLGKVATTSAMINQERLPKPHMDEVLRLMRFTEAAGVVVAHSGTAIGLLVDHQEMGRQRDIAAGLSQIYGMKAETFLTDMRGPSVTLGFPELLKVGAK